jgi:hypothetical protein
MRNPFRGLLSSNGGKPKAQRRLALEGLEERCMLTGSGGVLVNPPPPPPVGIVMVPPPPEPTVPLLVSPA